MSIYLTGNEDQFEKSKTLDPHQEVYKIKISRLDAAFCRSRFSPTVNDYCRTYYLYREKCSVVSWLFE